jgi:integrase
MATFSIVVMPYKRKDGLHQVSIRVTWNRDHAYIKTEYYVPDNQIDKGGRLKDAFINRELFDRITQYQEIIKTKLKGMIFRYSVDDLATYLVRNVNQAVSELDFIEYAESEKVKQAEGTIKLNKDFIKLLKRYISSERLLVHDITSGFLAKFDEWLREGGITQNSVVTYMGRFRAIFNRMRDKYNDEDKGDMPIPHNPWKKYRIPPVEITRKRGLTVEQIIAIRDAEVTTSREELARDAFMLSFYLAGMNPADMFNLTDYKDGRISYYRQKTKTRRKDKAYISILVQEEALPLFAKYKDDTRVFSFHRRYGNHKTFLDVLNTHLKFVGNRVNIPDLEHGAARHSFATLARNDAGVNKYDIHEALNHIDPETAIDDVYINRDFSVVDKTIRAVLDVLKRHGKDPAQLRVIGRVEDKESSKTA